MQDDVKQLPYQAFLNKLAVTLVFSASLHAGTVLAQETGVDEEMDRGYDLAAPEAVIAEPAPLEEEIGGNGLFEDEEVQSPEDIWQGTIMFSEQDVNDLMAVYESYRRGMAGGGEEDITQELRDLSQYLRPGGEEEVPEEVLRLSLASVIYHTDADWSIWVNGRRYYRDNALQGFMTGSNDSQVSVVDVSPEEVSFVWTPNPDSFSKVAKRWEEKLRMSQSAYNPDSGQDSKNVHFDTQSRTVAITLQPNQTFVSQFMTVMEGVKLSPSASSTSSAKASNANKETEAPIAEEEAMTDGMEEEAMTEENVPRGRPQTSDEKERAIADDLINQYEELVPGFKE